MRGLLAACFSLVMGCSAYPQDFRGLIRSETLFTINAPADGDIGAIHVGEGSSVSAGDPLISFQNQTFTSPVEGTVQNLRKNAADQTKKDERLLDVVAKNAVIADFHVPHNMRKSFAVGDTAAIEAQGVAPKSGQIVFIAPKADAASGLFAVRVRVPNVDGAFKSGTKATIRLN